jgi:hypothetical protein
LIVPVWFMQHINLQAWVIEHRVGLIYSNMYSIKGLMPSGGRV